MNTSEVKKYSKGLVNSIKSGKITLEEAVIESSTKTGCTKDYARKILNDYLKSGYSNNPDYVGDWFGKGQIDFNAIINPEDDGDVWMVKMWSGSGYTLDVYLCKATNLYDAIDTVFEWSWENEGENNMVFDLDYVYKEADEYFESDPYMFSVMNRDEPNKEDFEDRFIEEYYVGDSNYGLFARSENFFVDKVPENVLVENQKPVQNSRKPVKSDWKREAEFMNDRIRDDNLLYQVFKIEDEHFGGNFENPDNWDGTHIVYTIENGEITNTEIVDSFEDVIDDGNKYYLSANRDTGYRNTDYVLDRVALWQERNNNGITSSRKSNKRRPIKSMAAVSKNNRMDFKSLQNMAGMYLDREGIKFEETEDGLHVDQFGYININSETDGKTNRSQGRYSIELIPNTGDDDTYALFENAENDYYEGSSVNEFQEDMEDILREIFAVGRDNIPSIARDMAKDYGTDDIDAGYQFVSDAYP